MAILKDTKVGGEVVGAEEVVTPFQQPIAPIPDNTAEILTKVVSGTEDFFAGREKDALDTKFKEIKKFRTAADQGRISYTEARTRATAAVKSSINAMPWRADEFRKEAATFFGAYGEGWGLLNKSDAEKSAASFQDKLALAHAKNMQTRYQMPFNLISNGKQVDAAVQTQLDLDADNAKRSRDSGLVTKANVLDILDQQTRPLITNVSVKTSNLLNSFKMDGKTVLEHRMDGMGDKAILDKLGRNDQLMGDLTANITAMIGAEKRNISAWYDEQITTMGTKGGFNVGAQESKLRKDALLDSLDGLVKDINTTTDAKALFRFVSNQELSNKGALASHKANNMVFFLARNSGVITDDVMTKWIIDPESVRNPTLQGILQDTFTNVQQIDVERWWDKVKTLPSNFDVLSETNPKIANIAFLKVKAGMPQLMSQGWDKDALTKKKQQDFFTMGSYMHLFKTSPTRPNTIENFEKMFFDPSYQKLLHSLPATNKQHIMKPLRKKVVDIIYNEESGTGVLQRIQQASKDFEKEGIKWDVGTDGQINVSLPFTAVGEGSKGFQEDITADLFGDNIDRLNNYLELYSSLMPKSFNKQDFTNKIVDSLRVEKK